MSNNAEKRKALALEKQYGGKTILAVGTHPNDIEAGAGGTLARLSAAGSKVIMVVVGIDHNLEQRTQEAISSAKILGAAETLFFFPGKEVRVEDLKSYELIDRMDRLVREYDPAAVFTHAGSSLHHDNVLVHKASVVAQRLHFFDMFCFYPTNCHPITTPFHPNVYVDISATMETKMAAINGHSTHYFGRGNGADIFLETTRQYGRLAGTEYAEAFEVSRLIFS